MIIKKIVISGLLLMTAIILSSYKYFIPCKTQGIKGHVYLIQGNQMPSPDIKQPPPRGLATTIYVYELTNLNQVKKAGNTAFYSVIHSRLVKTVKSDKNGVFKVALKAGEYSLFIKKDTLFYANRLDGKNNINPLKVEACKYSNIDLRADYDAVY